MRVLIVEDDEDIRDALAEVLEFEDIFVHTESNGLAALKWLRCNPRPTVIILDLWMPVMDGFDFLTEQARDEELKTIPVIVITSSGVPVNDASVYAVLRKPIKLEHLDDVITSLPRSRDPRLTADTLDTAIEPPTEKK